MLQSRDETLNLDELRQRLRKMDDAALLRWGRAGVFMCSPEANFGHPPRDCYVVQLAEARAEWKRRHGTEQLD